jgi:putative hydrolases of HD superfamily
MRKGLIERFYEAASIQRWNDHVRPFELTELDKQAHKMIIAFILAKSEETDRGKPIDWGRLIEGGLFEFLQRVLLTDLKPPVFHRLMQTKRQELNRWVLQQLDADIADVPGGFKERFVAYFEEEGYSVLERRILRASHYLATNWEFKIIYNLTPFIYGIEDTKAELENQIEDHYDLLGVQKLMLGKKSFGFIDFCGQLRFQQRWAQTPRIPKTSVLGHMLIVAMLSYLCSLEMGACPQRIINNYFGALFHDLPEVLTRDIVSPVKSSVAGIEEIIKEYEKVLVDEKLLPLLPASWHEEIRYYIEDEFANKVKINGEIKKEFTSEEISAYYNEAEFMPLDGRVLKICDHLAAYIEATLSIQHGLHSQHLEDACLRLHNQYHDKVVAGINFGRIFDDYYSNVQNVGTCHR